MMDGVNLHVTNLVYSSKDAYLTNVNNLKLNGIPEYSVFPYDRVSDGVDVLQYIHDEFKSMLSTDLTEERPLLDPSTGEEQLDPSTGEVLTQTIVIEEKFAEAEEIEIVDIDD